MEETIPTEIGGVRLPDSPICRAATDYARRVSPPFLFNHALRSYMFADRAAELRRTGFDREILYVAAVLHDLGLTDIVPVETRFEVEGADAAKAFLVEQGMTEKAVEIVWQAIALHTTPEVPQRMGAEIALCQIGTAIDVGFVPYEFLSERVVAEILEAFPRLGFKKAMVELLAGLGAKNSKAARMSPVVAEVCDHRTPAVRGPHFCSVIEGAAFAD